MSRLRKKNDRIGTLAYILFEFGKIYLRYIGLLMARGNATYIFILFVLLRL
jgi:hypothetical protein